MFMLALNCKLTKRTRTIKAEERRKCVPWRHPHKPKTNCPLYFSLKYKIKTIAMTRAAIMVPIIHLFLLILLDMAVKTFLLFPMLSSTPCSCNRRKTIRLQWHVFLPVLLQGKTYRPSADRKIGGHTYYSLNLKAKIYN
jgi:hypothetical protein